MWEWSVSCRGRALCPVWLKKCGRLAQNILFTQQIQCCSMSWFYGTEWDVWKVLKISMLHERIKKKILPEIQTRNAGVYLKWAGRQVLQSWTWIQEKEEDKVRLKEVKATNQYDCYSQTTQKVNIPHRWYQCAPDKPEAWPRQDETTEAGASV